MARRVLIASAVTESPRLIIADEPTPGLDKKAAGRILGHFRELAEEGAGILFITHDLELALTVAGQGCSILCRGDYRRSGCFRFKDVEKLRHPFTKSLWHAMLEHGFHPIPGSQPYPGTMAKGCPFARQCRKCTILCREADQISLKPYRADWYDVCIRGRRRQNDTAGRTPYIFLSKKKTGVHFAGLQPVNYFRRARRPESTKRPWKDDIVQASGRI